MMFDSITDGRVANVMLFIPGQTHLREVNWSWLAR